jgi:pimeloyl-ACP methyl ester carboxylesterase
MNLPRLLSRLICCFYMCALACSFSAYGQQPVPRFETSECAVPVPAGEKVECGYLVVREDRTLKNSPAIRLPIIILQSDNPQPQPDPILRTFGGPGSSSLRMINSRRFSPWLKDRNVIIFEQRGTRYTQPALECPEVNDANINSAKQNLDAKTARANEVRAARACHERLTKQGINLSAYNSAESAADIEDLRRVLKLDKINLHGVSYSARLMLNVMRDYPQGIRSVVLESTLPPQVNYDEAGVDAIVRSLNTLFRNCKSDARCAVAYPKLEEEFYAVVSRLNKQPISASVKDAKTGGASDIKLDGNDFATWLIDYLLSQDAEAIADAPLVIHQTFEGKYDAFKRYANEKTSPSTSALGMRYSVWCGEEMPFENRRKITSQSFRYPQLKGYEVMALPDICRVWTVRAAKRIENSSVKSDVPTLILTAEYDAYTPPAWGALAAQRLKNSFLFEVPWAGHGPAFSSPCAREMIAEFFARPAIAPKSDCLRQVKQKYSFVVNK